MADMNKILNSQNYPVGNFTLSTINRDLVELADGIDAQMNKIETAFTNLETSFKGVKTRVTQQVDKGKDKIDEKTRKKLRGYISKMDGRIKSCEAANTQLAKAYKADAKAIRDAEKKAALNAVIDALIGESSISDSTKSLLEELKKLY